MSERSSEGLFRREAVTHAYSALPGKTVVHPHRFLSWGARLLPMVAVLAGAAISSLEYARTERVVGVLAPSLGSSRVVASIAGTLRDINVFPGEQVVRGHVLAVLVPDLSRSGGSAVVLQQLDAARHRKNEIRQQVEATRVQHDISVQRLNGSIAANELERKAISEQIVIQDAITRRLEQQAEVGLALARKKLISEREAEQRQNHLDDARSQAAELKRELARLDATLLQTRSDLAASGKELQLSLSRLSVEELEIASQIAGLEGETSVAITSPVSGNVDYVAYRPGQTALEGSLLFSVIPSGSDLRAELFVPSQAIPRVKIGQPVRIEFDAFPAEFFGYAKAYLTSANETLLDPSEARLYNFEVKTPVYRLVATLDSQSVKDRQQEFKLRSGMSLTADIVTEKHPLYVWMWRELTRASKAL